MISTSFRYFPLNELHMCLNDRATSSVGYFNPPEPMAGKAIRENFFVSAVLRQN